MFDKRKDTRKKLMAFTPVYTVSPRTLLGYLEDLTVHGARVVGDVSLEENSLATLSIEFPKDTPNVPSTPFVINARVARSHQDETQYENLGFEFVEITPEQTAILEAVIQRYEFHRAV
ncbi:MAG: PilZ domain-containing protein [Anaerolineales bacterium]|nr:PilZ domain-containing protein [Anaerolineales bacterium]